MFNIDAATLRRESYINIGSWKSFRFFLPFVKFDTFRASKNLLKKPAPTNFAVSSATGEEHLTKNLHNVMTMHIRCSRYYNPHHTDIHTSAAKSTLIFEEDVRWRCSYFSLLNICTPKPPERWISSQLIAFPSFCHKYLITVLLVSQFYNYYMEVSPRGCGI